MPHRLNLTQFNSKHVKMSATITTWYTTKHTKYNLNTSTIIKIKKIKTECEINC